MKTREELEAGASDELLSDADRHFLHVLISEAKEDLDLLNLEILRARWNPKTLMKRRTRDEVMRRIERLRSWEAPHKYVPPEILAKIFVYCLHGPVSIPPSSPPSIPWLLGHICSRWRRIALEEHQLWDNILIFSRKRFPRLPLEEVIRRSGETRIMTLEPLFFNTNYAQAILPILQQHHNRFKSVKIEITRPTANILAEMFLFKHLESLSLHFGHVLSVPDINDPSFHGFHPPPTLRHLILSSDAFDHFSLRNTWIDLAATFWEHLTHLEIKHSIHVTPSSMLMILQKCEALVGCDLRLGNESGSAHIETEHVTLPCLEHITIESTDPILTEFLASLTLPSLKMFKILGVSEAWPQRELLALFHRSRCRLAIFSNEDYMMPLWCAMPLIRAMPDLTVLNIDTETPIPRSMIDTIISEKLLPQLIIMSAWFDSSRAALNMLEDTWAGSEELDRGIRGGIREGICYIDSADVSADEEGFKALKNAVLQRGVRIRVTIG